MQTYTHLFMGTAIGALIFPHDPMVQAACVAGAVLPDMPMILLYGVDVLKHRPPMMQQAPGWIQAKNIMQSLWVWLYIGFAGFFFSIRPDMHKWAFAAAGLCGMIHVVVDHFTHGDPKYWLTDGKYMWPFAAWQRKGWDYRIAPGKLWPPKPFEAFVLTLCIVMTVVGWLYR